MFVLSDFIASCQQCVGAPDAGRRVLDLMRSVVGDAKGIQIAVAPGASGQAILDAPLFRSPELLILNATLYPHFTSPPHDHRMWAVIGIYEGQENNTFYRRSADGLEEVNQRAIRAGEAVLLGSEVIHAIQNPLAGSTLGLHVYGGDLATATRSMWHPHSRAELPYDTPQFFRWCAELAGAASARDA